MQESVFLIPVMIVMILFWSLKIWSLYEELPHNKSNLIWKVISDSAANLENYVWQEEYKMKINAKFSPSMWTAW